MADQSAVRQAGRLALRIQQLVALTLLLAGVLWRMLGPAPDDEIEALIGSTLIVVGASWFVALRVLSWWHRYR